MTMAERFVHWYWRGWYESAGWDWDNRSLARRIIGGIIEWVEGQFFDDESLGNVVAARFICPKLGPDYAFDHCGRPEHRYCIRCNGTCGIPERAGKGSDE